MTKKETGKDKAFVLVMSGAVVECGVLLEGRMEWIHRFGLVFVGLMVYFTVGVSQI